MSLCKNYFFGRLQLEAQEFLGLVKTDQKI